MVSFRIASGSKGSATALCALYQCFILYFDFFSTQLSLLMVCCGTLCCKYLAHFVYRIRRCPTRPLHGVLRWNGNPSNCRVLTHHVHRSCCRVNPLSPSLPYLLQHSNFTYLTHLRLAPYYVLCFRSPFLQNFKGGWQRLLF